MELNKSLPDQLKLFNFAKKEISLSGIYQISDFPKISEIASNKKDNVLRIKKIPEFEEMKKHPDIGFRILSSVDDLSDAAKIILNHHA